MTFDYLYEMCRRDALSKGSAFGQVWHEADVDGYHLYIADTSFGDGPVFRISGPEMTHGWQCPQNEWVPFTRGTTEADASRALEIAARATWKYRLEKLDPLSRG